MYLSHILLEQKQNLLSDEVNYKVHVFETKRIILSVWKKKMKTGNRLIFFQTLSIILRKALQKKKFYKIASEIYMEDLKKSVASHEAPKGNK